jgi:hypothetical protein
MRNAIIRSVLLASLAPIVGAGMCATGTTQTPAQAWPAVKLTIDGVLLATNASPQKVAAAQAAEVVLGNAITSNSPQQAAQADFAALEAILTSDGALNAKWIVVAEDVDTLLFPPGAALTTPPS